MAVLTDADAEWLGEHYPGLAAEPDLSRVAGSIKFSAAYDEAANGFSILRAQGRRPPGELLACDYEITICEGTGTTSAARTRLPRLLVENAPYTFSADRHCSAGYSCLCGPSEEVAFARGYNFRQYLEELCIPFLYAQSYYSVHGRWPWPAYEHDALGALESYQVSGNDETLRLTIDGVLVFQPAWSLIRALLTGSGKPFGHMLCLCGSRKPIRHCHREAWEGLKKLNADVRRLNVDLPPPRRD